jgi:hypothetical protein
MNTMTPRAGSLRRDRLIRERNHDPYKVSGKLREPTICPVCKAVFRAGRWQWADFWPADSEETVCQACNRIRDGYPAGELTLSGGFVGSHQNELINLARQVAKAESAEHPLHRIMKIEEQRGGTLRITTTDLHLPRRIGDALRRAYKGRLDTQYGEECCFFRANWIREENHNNAPPHGRQQQRRR